MTNEQTREQFILALNSNAYIGMCTCDDMKNVINALDKQIPKKVIYGDYNDNGFDELIAHKAECPVCGYEFEFGEFNNRDNPYCKCGQKLNWEILEVKYE